MFFDFYVSLWGIISPNKLILVKIRLEKVDLGEVYIQKEQENFNKSSSSNTIGGSLHMSHPVVILTQPRRNAKKFKLKQLDH